MLSSQCALHQTEYLRLTYTTLHYTVCHSVHLPLLFSISNDHHSYSLHTSAIIEWFRPRHLRKTTPRTPPVIHIKIGRVSLCLRCTFCVSLLRVYFREYGSDYNHDITSTLTISSLAIKHYFFQRCQMSFKSLCAS